MSVKFIVGEAEEGKTTELKFSIHEKDGNVEIWVSPNTSLDMFKVLTVTKAGRLIHEDDIPEDIGLQLDSDGEMAYDYRSSM